ncbi:MAG: 3' terminal RNA ribose 2'-O-methyltransferase Hen1 [Deltaproteobacteria bacterium]|nr:3' terminal RNA ribose 2'-O-methyltransferase Hen1 [Deltaproteobacteria bacterium]
MLLTITATLEDGADLGYLLHKSPGRVHSFELAFGVAHVFYPEVTPSRATVAVLLEVDPVGLVRGRGPDSSAPLEQYVNDRPYVASSFLSVAIGRLFAPTLGGRSKERPDLAARAWPLVARISVLPCRGGEPLLRRLFEPLAYEVAATQHLLDETRPDWGASSYFTVELRATRRLAELLTHLYVLIPVLDDDKHYWVGDDEVDKLLKHGEGWLAAHPERELIARRYLRHRRSLARQALERLLAEEAPAVGADQVPAAAEEEIEHRISLNEQRLGAVLAVLKQSGAQRVLDLGCGEGHLLRQLSRDRTLTEIVGMDVSHRALEIASERLKLERLPERHRERLKLIQGSLLYRDRRLDGYDAAALVEVIEHLDPPRLAACERNVFEFAHPRTVVVTTPNAEFNVKLDGLARGALRHRDHRFEWSRAEFEAWAQRTAERFGYGVRFLPVGPCDATVGAPTQMGVFER